MPVYPVEQFRKDWMTERVLSAMAEAMFKQGLLTEAQRREVCRILKCGVRNAPDRRRCDHQTAYGGTRNEEDRR